jgi:phage-related protein
MKGESLYMAIRSSLFFTFNGRTSEELGIMNVNINSGMQSEQFASNRSIKEQKIRGRDKPYFQEIQRDPLELTVSFAFKDTWDTDKIRDVARWLTSPKYYSPLIFVEDEDISKIYYCLCIDSPELIHNCLQNGYINLKFRCVDAYCYTNVSTKIIDLSSNPSQGTAYTFANLGDENCDPLVSIYKVGAGDVHIFNQSDGNAEMSFTGLVDQETVIVDCEAKTIVSDIPLTYRYDNLVGDYLSIPIYNNYLLIKGNCKIKFTYEFKRIQ